jgi:hypothetical protein
MASVLCPLLRLRAFIALMLAVMALQAVPAKPLSLHPDNGPAISASSVEMALPVRRQLATDARTVPAYPLLAVVDAAEPVPLLANESSPQTVWPALDRVRAPPKRVLVPATPPRGPPLP